MGRILSETLRAILASLPALVLLSTTASGTTLTLAPTADNTVFEDAEGDTSNGAGPALFAGRNNMGSRTIRRALLVFDLGLLPAGARVDSAALVLHVLHTSDPLVRSMAVHRVNAHWGEGGSMATGGSGATARDGDATWLHREFPTRAWTTPGGDFEALPGSAILVDGPGPCRWGGAGILRDLREWLERPADNHGWIVLGDESAPGTARRFAAREHPEPTKHPMLILHYTLPGPAARATWGSVKASYR